MSTTSGCEVQTTPPSGDGFLSTSHKRAACFTPSNSNVETMIASNKDRQYAPEAKRHQLYSDAFFVASELSTVGFENNKLTDMPLGDSFLILLRSSIVPSKVGNPIIDSIDNTPAEETNIANTSDYIESLLNLITNSDDAQFPRLSVSPNQCHPSGNGEPQGKHGDDISELEIFPFDIRDTPVDDECADDTLLLSNLPTSVDDLQHKEFSLKLERHQSSPLISGRESPSLAGNVSSNARAFTKTFDCASAIINKTGSESLNKSFDELDADDLEVAMINESFEEQQKQSMIYDNSTLKSLFYGMPRENSTSKEQADIEIPRVAKSKSSSCSDVDGPQFANTSVSESNNDTESEKTTPPFNGLVVPGTIQNEMHENEFIPVLTPKSKQFVMKKRPRHSYPGDSANSRVVGCNGTHAIPPINPEMKEEGGQLLDIELGKMILEEDDVFPLPHCSSDDESATFHDLLTCTYLNPNGAGVNTSDDEGADAEESAQAIAYEVVASLFSRNEDQMRDTTNEATANFYLPMKTNTPDIEEKMLLSESLLKYLDAASFIDESLSDANEQKPKTTHALGILETTIETPSPHFTVQSSSIHSLSSTGMLDEQMVPVFCQRQNE